MNCTRVTVLVYHYVRDLKHSRYPDIKGLDLDLFKSQLDYLEEHYTFITIYDLINAIENGTTLPPKAVLLTFNDSYIDHFVNVFPLLDQKGIQGCFYPEIAAIEENKVLINHKIHFVLAAAGNSTLIKDHIFSLLDSLKDKYALRSNDFYFNKLAKPSQYDSADTIFVKRILQSELPKKARHEITDRLFEYFVGIEEKVFAKELYLNRKQVECMMNHGMHFGILGYHHTRYDTLKPKEQEEEISRVRNYLLEIGADKSTLTVSYPWGAYNRDTLNILSKINCKAAFTAKSGIADLEKDPRLELPRLDTNDIPKNSNAEPDHWFAKA